MQIESILTRTGYFITVLKVSDEVNHLIIRNSNLYPDEDSRSEEKKEFVIPINDKKTLLEIADLILKICSNEVVQEKRTSKRSSKV